MEEKVRKINAKIITVNPNDLTSLEENARYMTHEQFALLVENIKKDGCLTSTPLVWVERKSAQDEPTGRMIVLSGNHRTKAAIAAGLDRVNILLIEEWMDENRRIGLQLAHNSITGQDDPAMLKNLYERLDIELKQYSGIDDKMLGLLADVKPLSISEANLDFQTLSMVFLPDELEAAKSSYDKAKKILKNDHTWLVRFAEYDRWLDGLELAGSSHGIKNAATSLKIILEIFENNLGQLRHGWDQEKSKGGMMVPIASVIGCDKIPVASAKVIAKLLDKCVDNGEVTEETKWKKLESLCLEKLDPGIDKKESP